MAMTLVSSVNATASNVATIEFTNIPQSGKDLCVLASLRVTDGNEAGFVSVNNIYPSSDLIEFLDFYGANGSRFSDAGYVRSYFFLRWNDSSRTANVFGNSKVTFHDYTKTTASKTLSYEFVTENNGGAYLGIGGGYFQSNSAITGIRFIPQSAANFLQYSMVSLYIIS